MASPPSTPPECRLEGVRTETPVVVHCRGCGVPLKPPQAIACSGRCRAKWHRRARAEREARLRGLLQDVVRLRHPRIEREGRGLLEAALRLLGDPEKRA